MLKEQFLLSSQLRR